METDGRDKALELGGQVVAPTRTSRRRASMQSAADNALDVLAVEADAGMPVTAAVPECEWVTVSGMRVGGGWSRRDASTMTVPSSDVSRSSYTSSSDATQVFSDGNIEVGTGTHGETGSGHRGQLRRPHHDGRQLTSRGKRKVEDIDSSKRSSGSSTHVTHDPREQRCCTTAPWPAGAALPLVAACPPSNSSSPRHAAARIRAAGTSND